MTEGVPMRLESRRLEDGRGGVFVDGVLILTFPTEAESDSAVILACRRMVVDGIVRQVGQAFKDEKPMDLFDMEIR